MAYYFSCAICVLIFAFMLNVETLTFITKKESSITSYNCTDDNDNCNFWAMSGECEKNPSYMLSTCSYSCKTCHQNDKNDPCSRNNKTALVKEGDIKNTLENIAYSYSSATLLNTNPWIVQIDDFLNDDEISVFANICEGKYIRSLAGDGVSTSRTSEQCWCQHSSCLNNEKIKNVSSKISEMLQSDIKNTEFLQIIRYNPEQFYKLHHDQNAGYHVPCGPRVYTFFMYLSTPEEGGETSFPDINLKVKAKKGRAIVWNSVLNNNISLPDLRTHHEALPVKKGIKLAANYWFHLYDFRTPFSKGCRSISKNTYNPEIYVDLSKQYY